jgi:hypothetical protein
MKERFIAFGNEIEQNLIIPEVDKETGEMWDKYIGYSKRLDHRHHALDALIIACTKQQHIQYINTLNAQYELGNYKGEDEKIIKEKEKYKRLKNEIFYIAERKGKKVKIFYTPWENDNFMTDVKSSLGKVIISHKNIRLLISPSKHRNNKVTILQKTASLRGQLHDETNYAKRNYLSEDENKRKTNIDIIIKKLLKRKFENQSQTMIGRRSFAELINAYVFKEKYRKEIIPIFEKYDKVVLNNKPAKNADNATISVIQGNILNEIKENKLLINAKENKPLVWLSTFIEKNSSARPFGNDYDFNFGGVKKEKLKKKINDIADPRIKRLVKYRLEYIDQKLKEVDEQNLDKKEKDLIKAKIKSLKLYTNAIYEVRIKNEHNKFEWIELKNMKPEMIGNIIYSKAKITESIKSKLMQVFKERNYSYGDYFDNPICISNKLIPINKVRLLAWADDLFEIKAKQFVNPTDTFMAYIFELKYEIQTERVKLKEKEIRVLKFLEAISILNLEKPDKIKYSDLIPSPDHENYKLAFTLAKNDLVYLPEQGKKLSKDEKEAIDWDNHKEISKHLHIVKDINPSQPDRYFVLQKHTQADEITISEEDAKNIFLNPELTEQKETEKFGNSFTRDNCIKVFTDKLGKKIVPYWKFPNGCWDKQRAIELGLIQND